MPLPATPSAYRRCARSRDPLPPRYPAGAEFIRLGEVIGAVDGRTAAEVRSLVDHHASSSWLREVFVPAYEAKVAAFNDICTDTDERLASCWRRLTEALATINRSSARRTA